MGFKGKNESEKRDKRYCLEHIVNPDLQQVHEPESEDNLTFREAVLAAPRYNVGGDDTIMDDKDKSKTADKRHFLEVIIDTDMQQVHDPASVDHMNLNEGAFAAAPNTAGGEHKWSHAGEVSDSKGNMQLEYEGDDEDSGYHSASASDESQDKKRDMPLENDGAVEDKWCQYVNTYDQVQVKKENVPIRYDGDVEDESDYSPGPPDEVPGKKENMPLENDGDVKDEGYHSARASDEVLDKKEDITNTNEKRPQELVADERCYPFRPLTRPSTYPTPSASPQKSHNKASPHHHSDHHAAYSDSAGVAVTNDTTSDAVQYRNKGMSPEQCSKNKSTPVDEWWHKYIIEVESENVSQEEWHLHIRVRRIQTAQRLAYVISSFLAIFNIVVSVFDITILPSTLSAIHHLDRGFKGANGEHKEDLCLEAFVMDFVSTESCDENLRGSISRGIGEALADVRMVEEIKRGVQEMDALAMEWKQWDFEVKEEEGIRAALRTCRKRVRLLESKIMLAKRKFEEMAEVLERGSRAAKRVCEEGKQ